MNEPKPRNCTHTWNQALECSQCGSELTIVDIVDFEHQIRKADECIEAILCRYHALAGHIRSKSSLKLFRSLLLKLLG